MGFQILTSPRQVYIESVLIGTKLLVLASYIYLAVHVKMSVMPHGSFWLTGIVGFLIAVSMAILLLRGVGILRPTILFLAVLLDLGTILTALTAAYYRLGGPSGEIPKISNHVDALYFATTVLTTTGFGDIVAVGRNAKLLVSCQMLFDFVYLGTVITLTITSLIARSRHSDAKVSPKG